MKHDNWVNSAQFSPDGQRVVTASLGMARVWDVPTITTKDSADDVNLLSDLAEATAGRAFQTFGQTETLAALTPDHVKATRDRIAVKILRVVFDLDSASATPEVERGKSEDSTHLAFFGSHSC
jgi:WD40 repeat protein